MSREELEAIKGRLAGGYTFHQEKVSSDIRALVAEVERCWRKRRICPGCEAVFGLDEAHRCVTHSFDPDNPGGC